MGQVARDLVRIGRKRWPVGTYASIGTYGPKGTFSLIGAFSVIGTYRSVGTYTPNVRKILFRLLYCRVFTMLRPGSDIEFAASIYQLSLPELELAKTYRKTASCSVSASRSGGIQLLS